MIYREKKKKKYILKNRKWIASQREKPFREKVFQQGVAKGSVCLYIKK